MPASTLLRLGHVACGGSTPGLVRSILLTVLCLSVAAGCAGPPTGLAADLPGTTWSLERVVLPGAGGVLRGNGADVTFGADGSLSVSSCNVCNGTYRMRRDQLDVEPLACTRRGCAENEVELERYLTGTMTVRRDGTYLIIEATGEEGPGAQILLVPARTG